MKTRYLLSVATLTLAAGVAFAGLRLPVAVAIDLVNMSARGDQLTARLSKNDVEYIGCGVRILDDGVNSFSFGFCQAGDSDGVEIACFTQNSNLLDVIRANSDFSFILFRWKDGGFGGAECTRVNISTQSFYLPRFEIDEEDDSDSD